MSATFCGTGRRRLRGSPPKALKTTPYKRQELSDERTKSSPLEDMAPKKKSFKAKEVEEAEKMKKKEETAKMMKKLQRRGGKGQGKDARSVGQIGKHSKRERRKQRKDDEPKGHRSCLS